MSVGATALRFLPKGVVEVAYPKGAIILCLHCGKPLYRLQQSVYHGEPTARAAWKFAPVTPADWRALVDRSDLDPGQRGFLLAVPLEDRITHCQQIPELRPGAFLDCPACTQPFCYGVIPRSADASAQFSDKGYVVQLAMIPPQGEGRRA